MLFTEPTFLFVFLPAVLALALCGPIRWRNAVLAVASVVFYARGAGAFTLLILGSIAREEVPGLGTVLSDGAFLVKPQGGVQPEFYRKRHLVPFGEYIPFQALLGRWIQALARGVATTGDFAAADHLAMAEWPLAEVRAHYGVPPLDA